MRKLVSHFAAVGLISLAAGIVAPRVASADDSVNCAPTSAVSAVASNPVNAAYDSYGECYYECWPVGDETGNDQYRTCWNNCVARYYRHHGHY